MQRLEHVVRSPRVASVAPNEHPRPRLAERVVAKRNEPLRVAEKAQRASLNECRLRVAPLVHSCSRSRNDEGPKARAKAVFVDAHAEIRTHDVSA